MSGTAAEVGNLNILNIPYASTGLPPWLFALKRATPVPLIIVQLSSGVSVKAATRIYATYININMYYSTPTGSYVYYVVM